ncbi:vacuolar sorting protein 39 [Amaranthus tricolor]|uniref:vacuolar sorting protein 39 n=1 Tax=Amaranthus tricolor TaxID=29722 RepID=UPI00258BE1F3|nr:vacuolar sorting protein 39 [Amaranthus tricolor]XP_057542150.1 vacuolar sorting protein 39 [Amaranthus tricolor]
MVHSAYDSFELLCDSPTKIDAVESYGSKLIIGCNDGSLRIYSPESSSSDVCAPSDHRSGELELLKESYVLDRTMSGFSRRPITVMEVLRSKELLLTLSESISFHKLPSLETVAVIAKAKGASAYSWDDSRAFLCFSRQRRVCIFRHDGGRGFVEVKDYGVPDTVKSMAWCGENICIGVRKEYMMLNASTGVLSEVFSSGRISPPLVVSLPSGGLLLGKDNIGVFVDQYGKLGHEGRICWSEAPSQIVIHEPYAIGLLPRHVEIRSLQQPYPLIQTVSLRNVKHLIRSNSVILVSLEKSVSGLFPVPLGAQIVQLTASGHFEEALSLCKLLPPEDSSLRAAKESSIHIRYAHHLFENGSYEEAMDHFLASQVDITYVLSLYPSIIVPNSTVLPEPEKVVDFGWDTSDLSRCSSGMSDEMDASPRAPIDAEENSAVQSKIVSHNTLMALIKFLQKKRYNIIEKAAAEGTDEAVSDAFSVNFRSYDSNRSKKSNRGRGSISISSGGRERAAILDTTLLQALILTGQPSAAVELLTGMNYCDLKISEEFLKKTNQYTALLELYKCNGMHREALKLLLQLVEESKSDHAAELTKKFTPEMIIDYLKPLCGTDPMLVLEFAMLVLESCPTQTIELFLSGNIPADLVNSYLKQHAPNMQATYLELMLSMNEDGISGNLQNEMLQIYLSEVLDWYRELSSQQQWDETAYSPTRKKLLAALENISGYNPEGLLKRLPADALYEERAILLGKLNQHELALSLYVHKLHVPELALSYCDRVYESQPLGKFHSNIYLTLLQIYLNPKRTTRNFERRINNLVSTPNAENKRVSSSTSTRNKGGRSARKIAEIGVEDSRFSPSSTDSVKSDGDADELSSEEGSNIMLDEALDLLSRRWERINGAQALKLLPKETKLKDLLSFLGPLLRKSSEAHRNFSVIRRLRESENLQVKDELYNKRKAVVKVSGDSMCSLCNKKIGTSVFAVYPNGTTLVHFVCFRDSQTMKAVRGSQSRKR